MDKFFDMLASNFQPEIYIQLIINIIPFFTLVVTIIIFVIQIHVDRKKQAVKIGLEVEQLVVRWAYIDYILERDCGEIYRILHSADTSNMKLFESDETKNVYTQDCISGIKELFEKNEYNPEMESTAPLLFCVSKQSVSMANDLFPKLIDELFVGKPGRDYSHVFHRILTDTLNKKWKLFVL